MQDTTFRKIIDTDPCNIRFLDYFSIRNDTDKVMYAAKKDIRTFKYASFWLRNDKNFVRRIVFEIDPSGFQYAGEHIRDADNFVTGLLMHFPKIFYWVSDRLKNDGRVVLQALRSKVNLFGCASDRLKHSKEFVMHAIRYNPEAYLHASYQVQNDREVILEVIQQDPSIFQNPIVSYQMEKWLDDEEFLSEILIINDSMWGHLPDRFKRQYDGCMENYFDSQFGCYIKGQ